MTGEGGAASGEESVASLTVRTDAGLLPAVVDFVSLAACRLGLQVAAAEHLGRAVEVVCRNVVEHAFASRDEGEYDVRVLRRPGQVVVAVEDRGLPFDYEDLRSYAGATLPEALRGSFTDGVRFVNLGRGGNRVELMKHLPHADLRKDLPAEAPRQAAHAPITADEPEVEIRMMRPEEATELSRCVYRSYGYSYDWDYVYYPERIRELQQGRLMCSCVAATPDGEIVGHLALRLERPDSPVGEAGQAVVDPRLRGHRLFERMKTFLAERAREWGLLGLYSEATAVHPYSQMGNLRLGAQETGFLLGYIPATVDYREIGVGEVNHRGSVALFYMRTNPEPERAIYPPTAYRDLTQRVVEHNGLRRVVGDDGEPTVPSQLSAEVRRDHNLASLCVDEPGTDLQALVRTRLRELLLQRVDCVYLDLPLSHPATPRAADGMEQLGFFFGGILPELREGDVLRLQYLNNVEVANADVRTASAFGRDLLDAIFQQKGAVESFGV